MSQIFRVKNAPYPQYFFGDPVEAPKVGQVWETRCKEPAYHKKYIVRSEPYSSPVNDNIIVKVTMINDWFPHLSHDMCKDLSNLLLLCDFTGEVREVHSSSSART